MLGTASTLRSSLAARGPGLALAGAVALAALALEQGWRAHSPGGFVLPGMVIALAIGVALNGLTKSVRYEAGLTFAVKSLLRIAIALLGLRISLGEIVALGPAVALLVIGAMAATIASGFALARALGRSDGFGALAGAATAVCGASATLATAAVVPDYREKSADIAFTVVMANAVSTLVMLAYPPIALALGLDARATGILLGLTIHDMAQVVGAGYAVSEPVGNTAVIVKLFRVFLLLPAVLLIGHALRRRGAEAGAAKVPVPGFAVAFLVLALVNSILPATALAGVYAPVKAVLGHLANGGLLLAIAALGLGTSPAALRTVGWRHLAVFSGTTLVILAIAIAGILLLG